MVAIEIVTINADVDYRYDAETDKAVPHVVLKYGDEDIRAWKISDTDLYSLTEARDQRRHLQQYVAARLAALFAGCRCRA